MKPLRLLLLLLLCVRPAPAQTIADAVVRVRNGTICGGSGTCIDFRDGQVLVVTCDHLFWHGTQALSVAWNDGSTAAATLLKRHPRGGVNCASAYDVALLVVRAERRPVTVPLARAAPPRNAVVWKVGYPALGGAQVLDVRTGRCWQCDSAFRGDVLVRSGDSGGGFFDADGCLIGVVSGDTRDALTHRLIATEGAGLDSVRALVSSCWPRGKRPAPGGGRSQVGGICGPGGCPSRPPSPYAPPAPAPPSPPAPPAPPAASDPVADELAKLRKQLEDLKPLPGPKGERGQQGPAGERGPAGPPGKDGKDADTQKLENEIALLRKDVDVLKQTLGKLSGSVRIKIDPNQPAK